MKNGAEGELLRRDLDAVLKKWRKLPPEPPKRGWVHNVRIALGMGIVDLGARMKISHAGISALEASEAKGTIQLDTLRRAARAMDCQLVYALVPKQSLTCIVENRRRQIARKELATLMPMTEVVQEEYKELVAAYANQIKRKKLWRER